MVERKRTNAQTTIYKTLQLGVVSGAPEGKTVQLPLVIRGKGRPNLLKVKACNCQGGDPPSGGDPMMLKGDNGDETPPPHMG